MSYVIRLCEKKISTGFIAVISCDNAINPPQYMAYSSQMVQLVILPDEAMANITFNAVSKVRNCLTFKDIRSAWCNL